MAQPNFDYKGALDAGYTEDEINDFIKSQRKKAPVYEKPEKVGNEDTFAQRAQKGVSNIGKNFRNFFGNLGNPVQKKDELAETESPINPRLLQKLPNFDVQGALESGYSPEEINEFLEENQPKRSYLEKGARIGTQLGLGALQGSPAGIAYDVSTAPLASKEAMNMLYREDLGEELDQLMHQKASGQWTDEDEKFLQHIQEQIRDPRKSMEFAQTADVGIRGLAEKATGLDLHPEGILEKGANWIGFIKNPTNWKEVIKIGLKPKELFKAISPSLTETARGLSAGTALEMAEEGNFGPVGTIAAAVVGDLSGFGPKGLLNVVKNPKKTLAQATNLVFSPKGNKDLVRQIVRDAEESGITLDAGTLTNSKMVQMIQARAAQSALSGKSLDNFKKDLSQQFVKKYGEIADELGVLSFENNYQASEAINNFVNKNRTFRTEKTKSELNLPQFVKKETREGRPLVGRIATEPQPNYQEEFLNRIAPREFESSYQAGENLKTAAEDIKAPIKQEFNQRWENLNRQVGELPAGPQAQLARSLEVFVNDHAGSLLLGESSAEARVLQTAQRLRNALMTESGDLVGVSLKDLIKTKRTLGDVANWEFGGSNFQSAYKHLTGEIDHAIERTLGEVNPQLREVYEELNHSYSVFKDLFENKNVMPLFEPKNQNYNSIYSSFLKNPDKLRSLEDIMFNNPRGQQLLSQIKRDYAKSVIERPRLAARDLRDLEAVLGPQYSDSIREFLGARHRALEQPLPHAARQPSLGARAAIPETTTAGKPLGGRAVEKSEHARQKLLEYIKGKSSDQVMKMMDTVDGIKKLKRALNLTPDGEELFKELARYKLSEMIDKKMMDNLKENVKLGTFSMLLKPTKESAVVKELIGPEAFKQFQLLQTNAGRVASSAEKFYNASKSGSTLADVGASTALLTGVLTGNPYLAITAGAPIGGLKVAGYLLSDPKFLKYLAEAVLTENNEKFIGILKDMKPHVNRAIVAATAGEEL
jgi:hypothetical protein